MSKQIFIIAHTFPPFGGVAGRRWHLFAEYLLKHNYSVKIIAAKGKENTSPANAKQNSMVLNSEKRTITSSFIGILNQKRQTQIQKKVVVDTVFLKQG